jgi:hypothetical protein
MTPTIAVRNNPIDEYKEQYGAGLGQRHMMADYVRLLEELDSLRSVVPNIDHQDKATRKQLKVDKKVSDQSILELKTKIRTIEKHLDYCALFTASLPEVSIMDGDSVWKTIRNTTGPYIVRAMASKKYMDYAAETGQDYIFLENGYFGNYKNLVNEKSKKQWHRVCVNEMQQESILDVPGRSLGKPCQSRSSIAMARLEKVWVKDFTSGTILKTLSVLQSKCKQVES